MVTRDEYARVLRLVQAAYNQSRVKTEYPNWAYGVTATRLIRRRPLIVGSNWGVNESDKGYKEPTPADYPDDSFDDLKPADLNSLVRLRPFLKEYLRNVSPKEIGQTNLYLFRTARLTQLCAHDRMLCLGAFLELLRMARPSVIVALSNTVSDVLKGLPSFACAATREFQMTSRQSSNFTAIRGSFGIEGHMGDWVAVPHPATPCSGPIRTAIWQFCFPDA